MRPPPFLAEVENCVRLHGMGKDMGERFSVIAGIDPQEWPVLAAVFDHTVWIRAKEWHAEQFEKDRPSSKDSSSAQKRWLEEGRKRLKAKYADKIERMRANGS